MISNRALLRGTTAVRLNDAALSGLVGKVWYVPGDEVLRVQVTPVPTPENRDALLASALEVIDWTTRDRERSAMKDHLQAVVRRYISAVHAQTWPELTNHTHFCFKRGADINAGRITRCAACTAFYCSVTRQP